MSTLPTSGTVKTLARIPSTLVAQLTLGQAVAGEGIDVAEHVAETIVEARPDHPLRNSPLISAIMLRTRTQVGLTSAAFVVSRR